MRSDYQFIETDTSILVSALISAYEKLTGVTVRPASPERLFILWVADVIVQTRVEINYAANQNIPSRAIGENLDALGELFYTHTRPQATAATCTVRFVISEAQTSAILIPSGTRVTDASQTLVWETANDAYVPIGSTYVDIPVQCQTAGIEGNGYVAGQINTIIDVFAYYLSCSNITESDGGADQATDEEFFALLKASEDAYSTAGPEGAYIYWAKTVSTEIADVKAIRPKIQITRTLSVYGNHAFLGGDNLEEATLKVYAAGNSAAVEVNTDYIATFEDNLLDIHLQSDGALATASQIDITIDSTEAGHVNIFALMTDGTIASDTIKSLILSACNDNNVRPLTDVVEVKDPDTIGYDIDITYYVTKDSEISAVEIQESVETAVSEYIAWQCERMGRDINPSKLNALLMETGIKRVEIKSPVFQRLRDGSDHYAPEVAAIGSIKITSGGYEDE